MIGKPLNEIIDRLTLLDFDFPNREDRIKVIGELQRASEDEDRVPCWLGAETGLAVRKLARP